MRFNEITMVTKYKFVFKPTKPKFVHVGLMWNKL